MVVQIVIYTLQNCLVCKVLAEKFLEIDKHERRDTDLVEVVIVGQSYSGASYIAAVRPRVFPTVIVFHNGVAKLGWEGFASLAPEEVKHVLVLEAYRLAAALWNSDQVIS